MVNCVGTAGSPGVRPHPPMPHTHSTKLPMAARGLQETYRSRLRFSALRTARITLESGEEQTPQGRVPSGSPSRSGQGPETRQPSGPPSASPHHPSGGHHSRRPARGGSRMAMSCWDASLLTSAGTRSSALPQWNSTLLNSGGDRAAALP